MENVPLFLVGFFVGGFVAAYWITYATLVAIERFQARRRGPDHSGRCVACGYDLRESPFRCPECGRLVGERWSEA